jgi:hypothetical protein
MNLVPTQGQTMTAYLSKSSFPNVYSSKMAELRLAGKKRRQSDLMQVLIYLCPKVFEECKTFVSVEVFIYQLMHKRVALKEY